MIIIAGLEVSEDLIKRFRLLHIKQKHNLTETAFHNIFHEMGLFGVTSDSG